ncbi:MAG: metal-dependent phosphohydrolase [Rhodomicrobium sp.]|nr:MAG: metal-dependent phosphohydrolase [Rhodomicrobium sp.]
MYDEPLKVTGELRLAELLSAMSCALDLTEGQPIGHCIRCCWIGHHIGRELGLTDQALSDLYYMLLLKDLGCSSNAARICELYLTDDLTFKHDFKTWDGSLPAALRFVLSHTGLQSGLAERFRALVTVMVEGGEIAKELIETRCYRGADIARKLRFSEDVALGIRSLDEQWDGKGLPDRLAGEDIPNYSRIALLSQVIDVFHTASGPEAALSEAKKRAGSWFDPTMVEAFEAVSASSDFWQMLASPDLHDKIYLIEPAQIARRVDEDYLDEIAEAFAKVVDSKSPFTSGHSERVTVFTDLIAEQLGYSVTKRRWLKRAALLHDIGKLGVSNSVLDKPGKLDDEEFAQIKMHPVYSLNILKNITAFSDIAGIAGGHHERLDGKGYPYGLKGAEIDMDTRIVTVADIFDALTADRPYRKAMPISKALSIMWDMVDEAIDPVCFEALKVALDRIGEKIAA